MWQLRAMLFRLTAILVLGLSACAYEAAVPLNNSSLAVSGAHPSRGKWFLASGQPRGVVLVVHGLNTRPEIMDPIATRLQQSGFNCYRITLSGHGSDTEDFAERGKAVSWLQDLDSAVAEIKRLYPMLPVSNVSYSLGGLVSLAWMKSRGQVFERLALLSPATQLTAQARFLKIVTPFRFFGWSLPSLNRPQWRAHDSTPLAVYAQVFALQDYLEAGPMPQNIANAPTGIWLNRNDELVSFDGTTRWVEDIQSPHWKTHEVEREQGRQELPSHLTVRPECLGERSWLRMLDQLVEFLSAK